MTEQRHDAAELRSKLLAMYSHRGDGIPTQYINPDGPDAVAEIERLTAENAILLHELNAMPNQTTNVIFKPTDDQSKSLHNSLIASFDERDVPETAESPNFSDAINRSDAITAVRNVLINGERPFSPLYPIAAAINALPAVAVTEDMVERAYDAWMNYQGEKDWDTRIVLRKALEAALRAAPSKE